MKAGAITLKVMVRNTVDWDGLRMRYWGASSWCSSGDSQVSRTWTVWYTHKVSAVGTTTITESWSWGNNVDNGSLFSHNQMWSTRSRVWRCWEISEWSEEIDGNNKSASGGIERGMMQGMEIEITTSIISDWYSIGSSRSFEFCSSASCFTT